MPREFKSELRSLRDLLPELSLEPGLYLVATPLGNPLDLGLRALQVLQSVSRIAAEDTRVSQQLLSTFGITKSLISYHSYNAEQRDPELLALIQGGESLALISDAGMPLISDPGSSLVTACVEAGVHVTVIPGPSAGITALTASGLDASRYYFYGFLPKKKGRRLSVLEELMATDVTLIFYEAPQRVPETLRDMATVAADRRCVVARELTKTYETYYRGTTESLADELRAGVKGECMILLEGLGAYRERVPDAPADLEQEKIREILTFSFDRGLSMRDSIELLRLMDPSIDKNDVYELALAIKEGDING